MYRHAAPITLLAITLLFGGGPVGAQETQPKDTHKHETQTPDLAAQLIELRAAMARLEAALEQDHKATDTSPASPDMDMGMNMMRMGMNMMGRGMDSGMSMGMKKKSDGMSMGMNKMKPGGMSGGGMKMKGGMGKKGSMGMGGVMGKKTMGDMGASADASVHEVSALPGFPGASHIYHIGATGFFVNHSEHLELTVSQLRILNEVREKETLKQSTLTRQIEEREQELWKLTSSDQPEAKQIETKIREIEGLRTDKRLSFIRSVGGAAKVLSEEQVKRLKGEPSSDEEHKH